MHFQIGKLDLITSQSGLLNLLFEKRFNLFEFPAYSDLLVEELEDVDEDLLEDHNDDQVENESAVVLIVDDGHEVGDVCVDKLEHVGLVDH